MTDVKPHSVNPVLTYIGSKNRIAGKIGEIIRATGTETMVDVFGGSASVLVAAGYRKRIYNDRCGDLVNFFRVISDVSDRRKLLRKLRLLPASREIYEDNLALYVKGGLSFRLIADPVDRAATLFYQSNYAYGGKLRHGGFCLSENGRLDVKQIGRWPNRLRALTWFGEYFSTTGIENKGFAEIISRYGRAPSTVLYCDPPYVGTENYYSVPFSQGDHVMLAHQLQDVAAAAVVSYYDCDLVRDLYPGEVWEWHRIRSHRGRNKNSLNSRETDELVLLKPSAGSESQ